MGVVATTEDKNKPGQDEVNEPKNELKTKFIARKVRGLFVLNRNILFPTNPSW